LVDFALPAANQRRAHGYAEAADVKSSPPPSTLA
jgi:hypothetical protein